MVLKYTFKDITNKKGKIIETVIDITSEIHETNKTTKKPKTQNGISMAQTNKIYKRLMNDYGKNFVILALCKEGWTTLKTMSYDEEDLTEYDEDYFLKNGGGYKRGANEIFLGIQVIKKY